MPNEVASHWNSQGEVDGHMSKFWGSFLMPIISIALFLLFMYIPRIDPLKGNLEKFRKYFDVFIVLIFLFLLYIHVLTLIWNSGTIFDMGKAVVPAVGVLILYIGFLLEKSKRNWFVGIRTPWTLSSDKVWKKTHHLGSRLFKVLGIIFILSPFVFEQFIAIMIALIIIIVIYLTLYSYLEYKKEKRR